MDRPTDTRESPHPLSFYQARASRHQEDLSRARRDDSRVSNLRLATFLIGTVSALGFVYQGWPVTAGISASLGAAAFLFLVVRHRQVARLLVVQGHLRDVNAQG